MSGASSELSGDITAQRKRDQEAMAKVRAGITKLLEPQAPLTDLKTKIVDDLPLHLKSQRKVKSGVFLPREKQTPNLAIITCKENAINLTAFIGIPHHAPFTSKANA